MKNVGETRMLQLHKFFKHWHALSASLPRSLIRAPLIPEEEEWKDDSGNEVGRVYVA